MKTLYIMRHATAAEPGSGDDFDRPLVDQGRAEAEAQGKRFGEWGQQLDRILVSSARRAQETAEHFGKSCGGSPAIEKFDSFYNATGETLMEAIRKLSDDDESVLLVSHMPGVGHLLSMLTTEHVDLAVSYPTATLSCVRLDADVWDEADYGVGLLALCMPPLPI